MKKSTVFITGIIFLYLNRILAFPYAKENAQYTGGVEASSGPVATSTYNNNAQTWPAYSTAPSTSYSNVNGNQGLAGISTADLSNTNWYANNAAATVNANSGWQQPISPPVASQTNTPWTYNTNYNSGINNQATSTSNSYNGYNAGAAASSTGYASSWNNANYGTQSTSYQYNQNLNNLDNKGYANSGSQASTFIDTGNTNLNAHGYPGLINNVPGYTSSSVQPANTGLIQRNNAVSSTAISSASAYQGWPQDQGTPSTTAQSTSSTVETTVYNPQKGLTQALPDIAPPPIDEEVYEVWHADGSIEYIKSYEEMLQKYPDYVLLSNPEVMPQAQTLFKTETSNINNNVPITSYDTSQSASTNTLSQIQTTASTTMNNLPSNNLQSVSTNTQSQAQLSESTTASTSFVQSSYDTSQTVKNNLLAPLTVAAQSHNNLAPLPQSNAPIVAGSNVEAPVLTTVQYPIPINNNMNLNNEIKSRTDNIETLSSNTYPIQTYQSIETNISKNEAILPNKDFFTKPINSAPKEKILPALVSSTKNTQAENIKSYNKMPSTPSSLNSENVSEFNKMYKAETEIPESGLSTTTPTGIKKEMSETSLKENKPIFEVMPNNPTNDQIKMSYKTLTTEDNILAKTNKSEKAPSTIMESSKSVIISENQNNNSPILSQIDNKPKTNSIVQPSPKETVITKQTDHQIQNVEEVNDATTIKTSDNINTKSTSSLLKTEKVTSLNKIDKTETEVPELGISAGKPKGIEKNISKNSIKENKTIVAAILNNTTNNQIEITDKTLATEDKILSDTFMSEKSPSTTTESSKSVILPEKQNENNSLLITKIDDKSKNNSIVQPSPKEKVVQKSDTNIDRSDSSDRSTNSSETIDNISEIKINHELDSLEKEYLEFAKNNPNILINKKEGDKIQAESKNQNNTDELEKHLTTDTQVANAEKDNSLDTNATSGNKTKDGSFKNDAKPSLSNGTEKIKEDKNEAQLQQEDIQTEKAVSASTYEKQNKNAEETNAKDTIETSENITQDKLNTNVLNLTSNSTDNSENYEKESPIKQEKILFESEVPSSVSISTTNESDKDSTTEIQIIQAEDANLEDTNETGDNITQEEIDENDENLKSTEKHENESEIQQEEVENKKTELGSTSENQINNVEEKNSETTVATSDIKSDKNNKKNNTGNSKEDENESQTKQEQILTESENISSVSTDESEKDSTAKTQILYIEQANDEETKEIGDNRTQEEEANYEDTKEFVNNTSREEIDENDVSSSSTEKSKDEENVPQIEQELRKKYELYSTSKTQNEDVGENNISETILEGNGKSKNSSSLDNTQVLENESKPDIDSKHLTTSLSEITSEETETEKNESYNPHDNNSLREISEVWSEDQDSQETISSDLNVDGEADSLELEVAEESAEDNGLTADRIIEMLQHFKGQKPLVWFKTSDTEFLQHLLNEEDEWDYINFFNVKNTN